MQIKFFVKKGKNKNTSIYIRFWYGRKFDQTTKTGLSVLFNNWDSKNERVRNKVTATDRNFINKKLLELKAFISENYNIEYNDGEIITPKWLKGKVHQFFNRATDKATEHLYFTDWISDFLKTAHKRLNKGKNLSSATIKAYKTVCNNLIKYEDYKGEKLRFEDVNIKFYFDFVYYCRNEIFYSENTIGNQIKYIKFYCRLIENESLPIPQDYKGKDFVKPREQTNDIYLTTTEIDDIFKYDFGESLYLDNARDLLIIGLNTGLRVSDFMRLDISNIEDDNIRIQAKKTGKFSEIPINKQIRHTLNKNGGKLPHGISEQKFNEYIKEIGKQVGLTEMVQGAKMVCIDEEKKIYRKQTGTFPKYELMTSHICRRSFATNLYGKVDTTIIMRITGHPTEKQFLQYIKKTEKENAKELRHYYNNQAKEKGQKSNLKIV